MSRPPQVGGLHKVTMECFLHPRYLLPPSTQLLGFCLFSTLEMIVGLHEEKPSTLPIADRTCLLQVLFRLVPQDIDAAHAAIPRSLIGTFRLAIMAKYRNNASPSASSTKSHVSR